MERHAWLNAKRKIRKKQIFKYFGIIKPTPNRLFRKLMEGLDAEAFLFPFIKHPYTCEITRQETNKPCRECDLPFECKYKR